MPNNNIWAQRDPWNLLGKTRKSKCCEGSEQEITSYDHTGATIWKCKKCGRETGWEYQLSSNKEMNIPVECKRHHITYDCYDFQCPECVKEYEAGSRILRRLTCQLCGELKGTTKMYCGGPVGYLCDDCKRIVDRYNELVEEHEKRWEAIKKERSDS